MTETPQKIAIVGGGASGVIAAANLLRTLGERAEIILIERHANIGRGLAYATSDPNHLLNVRAANMSAFPGEPDHFFDWLQHHGPLLGVGCPTRFCFVPRSVYGAYVASLLQDDTHQEIRIVQDECRDIEEHASGVRLRFQSGSTEEVDTVLLASGHDLRPSAVLGHTTINPWEPGALDRFAPDDTILAVGTGLTMVDVVLSLNRRGHRGRVVAISRRGLVSETHQAVASHSLQRSEVPLGAPISQLVRWVRRFAREVEADGGDWRSAIDALRPHTRALWQAMTSDQRRRFLRHARPWWDIHRHRMAPAVAGMIDNLRAEGRLSVLAARIVGTGPLAGGSSVTLRRRGTGTTETLDVSLIFDCTGLPDDPRRSSNPAIKSLFARGLARTDPLAIALDLTGDGAVIGTTGQPSHRIFAVGPLARGAFWEMIAIPDIRTQCAELAELLRQRMEAVQPQPA